MTSHTPGSNTQQQGNTSSSFRELQTATAVLILLASVLLFVGPSLLFWAPVSLAILIQIKVLRKVRKQYLLERLQDL